MRIAILNVSVEFLVKFCKGGPPEAVEVVEHALPADAKVVRLQPRLQPNVPWADTVELWLESKTFPDVPDGDRPPELPSPVFRRVEVSKSIRHF